MPASIADVARRASVSISTVSRVLNRREMVNPSTCARVEQAIKELGYQPNPFARGLMLRRSELVGLVLPDLHGEFYSEIIRGAKTRARELRYNLVVSGASDAEDMRMLLEGINNRALLDGVAVMIAEITDGLQGVLQRLPVPAVVVDNASVDSAFDRVVIDQQAGASTLIRHLVQHRQARRVFFVGGHATNLHTRARLEACAAVLREADLPLRPDDIVYLDYSYETAFAFATAHLDRWVGAGHFVFAANDEMASGIINAATARGRRVPQDLGVVGFDDTRIARMIQPPLTTVRVPMAQMGATSIELLCQRLSHPDGQPVRVSLQPELIVRASCGASIGQRHDPAMQVL